MAAVAETHPLLRVRSKPKLTVPLFGKLLILAWAEHNGRSDLPPREEVITELLQGASSAPGTVRDVMHVEDRITGPSIAEYTDFMTAAQDDGLLKRYNPSYIRCSVEVDFTEARNLLNSYHRNMPEVVDWLRERVVKLSGL